MRTDTERLDFIQSIVETAETKGVIIGGICYFSITVGRKRIGEGDDVRDAIDAAMDANTTSPSLSHATAIAGTDAGSGGAR